MNRVPTTLPLARRDGLTIETVGDEVLILDSTSNTVHLLNRPAAFVWQQADGTRTPDEIAQAMTRAFGASADPQIVWYALERLDKKHLLETRLPAPLSAQGITRRQFLKRAAAGAVLLAVVTSIVTPTTAEAQSACSPADGSCNSDGDCCRGLFCCVPINTCLTSACL